MLKIQDNSQKILQFFVYQLGLKAYVNLNCEKS